MDLFRVSVLLRRSVMLLFCIGWFLASCAQKLPPQESSRSENSQDGGSEKTPGEGGERRGEPLRDTRPLDAGGGDPGVREVGGTDEVSRDGLVGEPGRDGLVVDRGRVEVVGDRPVESVPEKSNLPPDFVVCQAKTGPTPQRCDDLVEVDLLGRWSYFAQNKEKTILKSSANALFGKVALRVETEAAFAFHLRYTSKTPLDISGKQRLHLVIRAFNDNQYGWQGNAPIIRLIDQNGAQRILTPGSQKLPTDGSRWRRLEIPLAGGQGWTMTTGGGGVWDPTKLHAVEIAMDTWGAGFWVEIDGMVFLKDGVSCTLQCPNNCSKRGRCVLEELRCACELGAVGDDCAKCGAGFVEKSGRCVLQKDGAYSTWPNPVSQTNGDAWLIANHHKIKLLKPKILALHYVNVSTPAKTRQLLDKIIAGFREGSRAQGYRDAGAIAQLELQIAKIVDLRDGENGHAPAPSDWPFRNSTFYPRKKVGNKWILDYSMFFSQDYARHYGYKDPKNSSRYLTLCELIERGEIHEVWMVGAHTEKDAAAAEVLEYKQRYTSEHNPIPGSFDRCAGNGCFESNVPHCARSVKIGFVNFERGPGCYLHSIGHGIEWSGSRDIVPPLQAWFLRFAGMDLDTRYHVPFNSLYAVNCAKEPCVSYQGNPPTASIVHQSKTYTLKDWRPGCGNVHFPPNGVKHYDYTNLNKVAAGCMRFGRPDPQKASQGLCNVYPTSEISLSIWSKYELLSPDCGGAFLVWWYQNMPAHQSGQFFGDGRPMPSIWPFLYY